jgi:hypothetical protein
LAISNERYNREHPDQGCAAIVVIDLERGPSPEDGFARSTRSPNDDLRLKYPSGVPVLFRLFLRVATHVGCLTSMSEFGSKVEEILLAGSISPFGPFQSRRGSRPRSEAQPGADIGHRWRTARCKLANLEDEAAEALRQKPRVVQKAGFDSAGSRQSWSRPIWCLHGEPFNHSSFSRLVRVPSPDSAPWRNARVSSGRGLRRPTRSRKLLNH